MGERTKAFCCWSGGKESALSLYKAKKSGLNISYLVNMISEDGKHSRSHGINSICLSLQSEAIGIPVVQRRTSWENYEGEFKRVVLDLKDRGIGIGVFGDVDLQEHRDWIERVCRETEIKPILPLWNERREKLLDEFIRACFRAIIVTTQADFLGKEWLGRQINKELVSDLKVIRNIDLCGENGEYHTFVYDGPIFKKAVKFVSDRKVLKDKHWFLKIIPAGDEQ